MKNKFYITTPIYYVNDIPAISHSYTNIDKKEPWVLYKKKSANLDIVLSSLRLGVKKLNVLIQPFMPDKAGQVEFFINKISNLQSRKRVGKLNLFPRINKNNS